MPQFPYPHLLCALRKQNPLKAMQLELWWITKCVPNIDTYRVMQPTHVRMYLPLEEMD